MSYLHFSSIYVLAYIVLQMFFYYYCVKVCMQSLVVPICLSSTSLLHSYQKHLLWNHTILVYSLLRNSLH